MNKVKTKLMVTRTYLNQLWQALSEQLDIDAVNYDMNSLPGAIRTDSLGVISLSIRNIEYEMKKIEDAVSLAEDMEKELVKVGK